MRCHKTVMSSCLFLLEFHQCLMGNNMALVNKQYHIGDFCLLWLTQIHNCLMSMRLLKINTMLLIGKGILLSTGGFLEARSPIPLSLSKSVGPKSFLLPTVQNCWCWADLFSFVGKKRWAQQFFTPNSLKLLVLELLLAQQMENAGPTVEKCWPNT